MSKTNPTIAVCIKSGNVQKILSSSPLDAIYVVDFDILEKEADITIDNLPAKITKTSCTADQDSDVLKDIIANAPTELARTQQ